MMRFINGKIVIDDNHSQYELTGVIVNGIDYPLLTQVVLRDGDTIRAQFKQSDKPKKKYQFNKK